MISKCLILFICVLTLFYGSHGQDAKTSKYVEKRWSVVNASTTNKDNIGNEKVKIQLFYECLCPDCRNFDSTVFKQTVLEMGSYLDIHLYPYGNANTIDNGGGNYTFQCQHGTLECYGNKLHACAIDNLQNNTLSVLFNSCLMDPSHRLGSDDAATDVCATAMDIDSAPIKECAKSAKGSKLLKYYGDESKKVGFQYVPYVLIDGVESTGDHFKEDVCKAFKNPPPQCKQNKYSNVNVQLNQLDIKLKGC